MSQLVQLIISLSILLANSDIDSDKQAACKRDVKIFAASKTLKPGEFYIFEEWKAWLYDAENQKLLEYYDIEETVKSNSPDEGISMATYVVACTASTLKLIWGRVITNTWAYKYTDLNNISSWTGESRESFEEKNRYISEATSHNLFETRGTACVRKDEKSLDHVHSYLRPKQFRYCPDVDPKQPCGGCCKLTKWGIYPPFSVVSALKEPPSFPEALAFEFDVEQRNQKVLFVYDDTIFYSTENSDGQWDTQEVNVKQVFGCKSLLLTMIIVGVAVVVFMVIVVAVITVVILLRRKPDFDENETVATFAKKTKAPKPSIK